MRVDACRTGGTAHLIPQHRNPSDAQSTLSPHRSSDHRPLAGGWRGVIKRRLYPWVDRLAEGVTALMASPSEYGHARTVIPKDGSPPFFQDYCNWSRIPAFSEFVFQSAAAGIAAALMQSQTAKFFHEHTLVKPAGGSTVTPWHHDQPYYCVSGRQNVSFWIPLDPVAEATSLRCIRGSHRWEEGVQSYPFPMALSFTSTPGSAPCRISTPMRTNTISSAGRWSRGCGGLPFPHRPWRPRQPRRAGATGLLRPLGGDDAAFADRGGVTSPPFPELTLRDGDPLDSPLFPQVWPRA